jgi:hypothetical protein
VHRTEKEFRYTPMMMCNILVMIDPRHPDGNTLQDIVDALTCMGASVMNVDPNSHMIEAMVAAQDVPTLEAMGGVAYVRPVFSYLTPAVA